MGNRAVIAFCENEMPTTKKDNHVGIYLHWNGGRDSVEGFCEAARRLGYNGESSYGIARFTQMVGNWFGGRLSVGVETYNKLHTDNYDNGVYWVDKNFKIVGREFVRNPEQKNHDLEEFVTDVLNKNKPADETSGN
jgi:hypothetical protein